MNERTSIDPSAQEIAARLQAEGEAVLAYFQRLTPLQWQQNVYDVVQEETALGRWRVHEILAHFIASERGFQDLIQNVASGGAGAGEGFDIDEYNRGVRREAQSSEAQVLLGQYAMVRERTVALALALTGAQLRRVGRHPFLGEVTVEAMLRNIYHHNSLHLRDVRAALRRAPETPPREPAG
jgi:hypothetical protein